MSIENIIAFQGEVQLLGWAETNTRGRTITLQLDNEGDGHPFAAAKTKSGKTSGQRYQIVMVEIGDDEKPVEKTPSQMAFLLCKDAQFQHYLNERSFVTVDSEESARACILEALQITSRSKIDSDPSARNQWLAQFYHPWLAYQQTIQSKVMA